MPNKHGSGYGSHGFIPYAECEDPYCLSDGKCKLNCRANAKRKRADKVKQLEQRVLDLERIVYPMRLELQQLRAKARKVEG